MKNKRIILYVLIAVIILLVGILGYNFTTNYKEKNNSSNDNNNNNTEEKNDTLNYAIYNNYLYVLPGYTYYDIIEDNNEKILHIYSNVAMWGASIMLLDKTKAPDGIFDNYDKLEESLKNGEVVIKNRKVDEYNNKKIVIFEEYGTDNNALVAYMPAYDNYEYQIILYDGDDKSMNYSGLKYIVGILAAGKKVS